MEDIVKRLKDACVGHPTARIAWPHRLLHDAIETILFERSEKEMLQEILDSRPAINAGLPESYIKWSQSIYSGDLVRSAFQKQKGK